MKMFSIEYVFSFILFPLVLSTPQINLHYTDRISEKNNASQYNCLRIAMNYGRSVDYREIISFCMNEFSSIFHVEKNNSIPKFTFLQLSQLNITSQHLYLWSASIDLIEDYQSYLNHQSTSNGFSMAHEMFYNCTLPRFGPVCQYELIYHHENHSSFNEIIQDFYHNYDYDAMTNMTCYTHLQCYRGPPPACLHWMEVCDGKVDCLDGAFDEADCWPLEINECKDDEYRCRNGQCIPQSFYQDVGAVADCIDISDEEIKGMRRIIFCADDDGPSFACEDQLAQNAFRLNFYWNKHRELLMKTMYSSGNSSVSEECSSARKCLFNSIDSKYSSCEQLCEDDACLGIVLNTCPEMFYFPNVPVLFGDIYFAYRKTDFQYQNNSPAASFYICYANSRYDNFFVHASKLLFNNTACVSSIPFLSESNILPIPVEPLHIYRIHELRTSLQRYHLIFNYTSEICRRSSMYQCLYSSKCISVYRLMDAVNDCPYLDDENFAVINTPDLIKQLEKTHFKCLTTGKYIPQSTVENEFCDCTESMDSWCEDEDSHITYLKRNIVFQHICDGFVDQSPVSVAGRNETDETECEQWECNNTYTRCNNVWNCLNGADEAGCVINSILNCSSKEHLCILPNTNQLTCLSIAKANDGNVDCLGATDEPQLCGTRYQHKPSNTIAHVRGFHCMNQSSGLCALFTDLCDRYSDCDHDDDERFCANHTEEVYYSFCDYGDDNCANHTGRLYYNFCGRSDEFLSGIEQFLCKYYILIRSWQVIHFIHDETIKSSEDQEKSIENTMDSSPSMIQMSHEHQPRCHRGLDLRVWSNNQDNEITDTCLCPPSFYGDQCQYQNQRISLTIKFRAFASSWQTLFVVIISLIDNSDQRIIHSYEQLTFVSVRNCYTKYNVYLLYSTRRKDPSKQYSIHIDIYEKVSLAYRGSLLFPVTFPFLPVYRLSTIADVPRNDEKTRSCSNDRCGHGQCIRYSNRPHNDTFCQCHRGWSGQYCNIPHTCQCALGSLCLGVSANNRSICVCPVNRYGPRCLLNDTTCQEHGNSTCEHGGQCISNDIYTIPTQTFTCVCRHDFSGDQCQTVDSRIILSFGKDIVTSQSIFIHFIEVFDRFNAPIRSTTFKTIPVQQESVTIHWLRPFHLVFIEIPKTIYYLAVAQKIYNRSTPLVKTINPSDRCRNISEVLNNTIVQWDPLRRIKYYHLPCQIHSPDLKCFYDNVHLCLCYDFDGKRLANCFTFNHSMTFDCLGQSECENDGQCFQDKSDCPTRSMCACRPCYYGGRCQFSTRGFGLSLDAILGYHIQPHLLFTQQSIIIQISLALTIIFIVAGLIDGILSLITFKNKTVCEVGCGLYLLVSSIMTLLITTMFGLKFLILVLAQMAIISNRSFLSFQCHSIDFVLRVCLCLDQWLNACVAIERTVTIIKGPGFVKKRSKQAAKFVILILLIVILGTCVHDPIHRRLIDEENYDDNSLKRTWCIVSYSSSLEVYDYIMHILHFFSPFLINMISVIILITKQSRQKSNVHNKRSYKEHLWEQCREHRHLLIAPIVLVIVAVPRLIISFISKCMQSANDSWLFLMGYFVSFIPPMLTFVVYIVPSTFYREQYHKSVQHFRRIIQR